MSGTRIQQLLKLGITSAKRNYYNFPVNLTPIFGPKHPETPLPIQFRPCLKVYSVLPQGKIFELHTNPLQPEESKAPKGAWYGM